ncbi:MAG TPA: hypothetical protein VGM05_12905 [Planctomycetaceae bacterium]|jgi:hypothetical protein
MLRTCSILFAFGITVSAIAQENGKDDDWKDATHFVKVNDDLTVFVGAVRRAPISLRSLGRQTLSEDELLSVFVGIKNESDTKKYDYRGWSTKTFDLERTMVARASDEFGNTYKRITFGITTDVQGQLKEGESVYPEKTVADILVFELPIRKAKELRLLLPGEAIGVKRPLRLKITLDPETKDGMIFDLAAKQRVRRDLENLELEQQRNAKRAEKKKADDEDFAKRKPERDEKAADSKLKAAESLLKAGKSDGYRKVLKEIVDKYPETTAGKKAAKLLK